MSVRKEVVWSIASIGIPEYESVWSVSIYGSDTLMSKCHEEFRTRSMGVGWTALTGHPGNPGQCCRDVNGSLAFVIMFKKITQEQMMRVNAIIEDVRKKYGEI